MSSFTLTFICPIIQNRQSKRHQKEFPESSEIQILLSYYNSAENLKTVFTVATPMYSRSLERKFFVLYKYFCLVLGLLKSRISEKTIKPLLNKPDFKLFHYKARVQPVSKITTVATRNRCWL